MLSGPTLIELIGAGGTQDGRDSHGAGRLASGHRGPARSLTPIKYRMGRLLTCCCLGSKGNIINKSPPPPRGSPLCSPRLPLPATSLSSRSPARLSQPRTALTSELT